jgi:hypothetical protein
MKTFLNSLTVLINLTLWCGLASAQTAVPLLVVATAAAVEGTVFVTRAGGRQVILARGSSLQVGDAINTSRNSTVRLRFTDGGETVVRPESTLVVQKYQYQKEVPEQDNIYLQLLKGGIRALTGAIGKRGNADAYQLRASAATVGIRGTDYSARLCQQDCDDVGAASHSNSNSNSNSATPLAARAVQVRGVVKVSRSGVALDALTEGQPLYSGDVLQTQVFSHVVLVFSDGARITVNPSTHMGISEYSNPAKTTGAIPGQAGGSTPTGVGNMIIDMFKGGLRFATGLIGKTNPANVKVRTATATIGIRGTVFDVVCAPGGSADSASPSDLGDMPCDESLMAQAREGTITLTGTQGEPVTLAAGQSGRVNGPNVSARVLPVTPDYFKTIRTPEPEKVQTNLESLFGLDAMPDISMGLLLTVHEGQVVLVQAGNDLLLDAGESAFAGRSAIPARLLTVPPILDRDPFLSSGMFNANMCRR